MVTLLNAPQKLKLRSDGHRSKFYLSVIQVDTLLSAQVNDGSIARGAVSIDFDNGTAADVGLIEAGMTVRVTINGEYYTTSVSSFSSSGSSPTITGTITVHANSIAWKDGATVEILDFYEPRTIPPTFSNSTGISRKRGQTWTNQTKPAGIPPIARLGPNRVGFVESGSLALALAGSGAAMSPGASLSTYAWQTTIGTIAAPSSQNTTLTITSPGQGWLSLTATDSNGNTHTGRRRIFAHSPDPDDADYPYVDFSVTSVSTSWDGSVTAGFEVFGVADFDQFIDGALVILWKQDFYGDEAGAISLITGGEDILFCGYITADSIEQDWNVGKVTFRAGNIIEVMKSLPMQVLSIHAENNPAYWFQYDRRLTIARALHWLWYWHSTIFEVADVFLPGHTLYKKLFQFNEGTLYSQGQALSDSIFARVTANRAGQLYVEQDIQALDDTGRAAISELTEITAADWREALVIPRQHKKPVSQVKLRGYYFDGQTLYPYCSVAPSKIRYETGSGGQGFEGIVVSGQAEANQYSGRVLAVANSDIREVRLKMSGNYSVIDVVPQRWLTQDLAADDTLRGLEWTDRKLVPRQVVNNIDVVNGFLSTDIICQPEAIGPDGVNDPCPTVPDTPAPAPPPWTGRDPAQDAVFAFGSVNIREDNASDWTEQTTEAADHGCLDPWWPVRSDRPQTTNPQQAILWRIDGGNIYRSLDAGRTWEDVTPAEAPPDTWSDGEEISPTFVAIFGDPWNEGRSFALASWQNSSTLWRGWLAWTENDGASWAWLDLYDGVTLPDQLKPIWLDVNGTVVLITIWVDETTDVLRLISLDAETADYSAGFDLGECSLAELEALTYIAYVRTVLDDDGLWYIFGRMNAPQSLANPEHIIKTTDAGSGWSSVANGHGTRRIATLDIGLLDGSDREHWYEVV